MPVLEMAVQILLSKRSSTGQPHAMLVRALNIPHTHRVAQLLSDNFPILQGKVLVIHSEHEQYDLAGRASALLSRFFSGECWVIVHCGMLGVGFDHKWISVSCNLCVLKSMSPAEQEWGRSLRKVPGSAPGVFPDLLHPNWAVVVTHSALGLRELFEKFLAGVTADTIKDAPVEKPVRPRLVASYSAGETVLRLSNTGTVKPGDVLELRFPVTVNVEESPAFSLVEELRKTGDLSEPTDTLAASNGSTSTQPDAAVPLTNNGIPKAEQEQLTLLPWQAEADAISSKLNEIRSYKTFTVQVEAVLDNQNVQITPAWSDIPQGVEITKSRASQEVPDASFLQHLGLDWQVLIAEELVSYSEYKKRTVLQQKGMDLDEEGEIVVGGVRLRDTLPAAAYSIFLKGLESELTTAEIEVPPSNAIARPDKAKLEMQARYGGQVRSLVNELFMQRGIVKDGAHGRSLVERPCALLDQAFALGW